MDDVVSQLRSKMSAHTLDEESGSLEERVERVLQWGSGHVLVTAKDVESATRLVEVALAHVNYFRLARVSAVSEDPHQPMVKVLTASGDMIMDSGFVELRNQVNGLVEQAKKAGQCIFVIVEDADQADVDQFERLRTTLDVGPEAIERLRLIIVGTKKTEKVLADFGARGLASRIGARIDASTTKKRKRKSSPPAAVRPQESSRFRSFVMTAASGTLMATLAISLLQPQLAPTVPMDLLESIEEQAKELAIPLEAVEASLPTLSEETKERIASAASLSMKIVHGKGLAHAESELTESGVPEVVSRESKSSRPVEATTNEPSVSEKPSASAQKPSRISAPSSPTIVRGQSASPPVRVVAKPQPAPKTSDSTVRNLPAFATPVDSAVKLAAKPATQTAPPVSKWTPKPGPDGYVLQVASFSAMANAQALKEKLDGTIDRVFIQKFDADGKMLFRVRVGGFDTLADSTVAVESLRSAGFDSLYVR